MTRTSARLENGNPTYDDLLEGYSWLYFSEVILVSGWVSPFNKSKNIPFWCFFCFCDVLYFFVYSSLSSTSLSKQLEESQLQHEKKDNIQSPQTSPPQKRKETEKLFFY